MSVAFASARPRGKGEVTQQTIQKMLDENHHLIQCILDYQSKGKTAECAQYQQILHRNLVYLATIADSNQNMQSLLPAPPTQNMNLGPGALSQSGSSQSLHSQGSLSDAVGTGLPPSSLMQGQIGNGPNHVSMQQTAQSTLPTTSMSMSGSGHGSGPGYSHSGPTSQSVPLQGQGAIGNYVSRANINMQSNPVSMMHQQAASSHYNSAQGGSQHYQGQSSIAMMGQSGQGSTMMGQRPMAPYRPSQQGHGDYAYQQSSYTEQSYDRSFEESTQHYYEGGGHRASGDYRRITQKAVLGSVTSVPLQRLPTSTHLVPLRDTAQTQPSFPGEFGSETPRRRVPGAVTGKPGLPPDPSGSPRRPLLSQSCCNDLAATPG
ncbi:calcium-responsive transactivator isoform X3 [Mustela erminea]|uniref:calcium-responsive transactivator isoform X3 n=1 Tax=Mustela erminea TaxID=36723 RepID=UPI00138713F6|nr:calcium-responsive transactivator isoform X3 [Mustela erminea]